MPPFVGACSLPTQESCTTGTVRPPRAASRRGPGVFENGLAYRDFAVTQSVASEKSGAHGTCLFNAGMRELSRQESDRRAAATCNSPMPCTAIRPKPWLHLCRSGVLRQSDVDGSRQPPSPSTAQEIEDGYVASDQNTTLLAVFEDTCVVEVTVQGAQDFGSSNHGGMNDRVVVRI
ncbi:MAG TPA: hypothetical protein VF311_04875 [Terriglobales bacterium]